MKSEFPSETMQEKKKWCEIFKVLRRKTNKKDQPRILCPIKSNFKMKNYSQTNKNLENVLSRDKTCKIFENKFLERKKIYRSETQIYRK